ncbi:hypothetical protein Dimus_026038 [Dionaea muscipula]
MSFSCSDRRVQVEDCTAAPNTRFPTAVFIASIDNPLKLSEEKQQQQQQLFFSFPTPPPPPPSASSFAASGTAKKWTRHSVKQHNGTGDGSAWFCSSPALQPSRAFAWEQQKDEAIR